MENISCKLKSFSSILSEYSVLLKDAGTGIIDILEANARLTKENTFLHKENDMLKEDVQSLEHKILQLKDENAAFSKVSHIVAMEKENARLQKELLDLKNKIKKTVVPVPPPVPIIVVEEKEEEECFYIKKIKGKEYYISEKDNSIYSISQDDDVGDKIGILKSSNGKTTPQWF